MGECRAAKTCWYMLCKECVTFVIMKVYLENVFVMVLQPSCASLLFSLSLLTGMIVWSVLCCCSYVTGWDPSGISAFPQCTPEAISPACSSSTSFWEQTFSLGPRVELTVVAKPPPSCLLSCCYFNKYLLVFSFTQKPWRLYLGEGNCVREICGGESGPVFLKRFYFVSVISKFMVSKKVKEKIKRPPISKLS